MHRILLCPVIAAILALFLCVTPCGAEPASPTAEQAELNELFINYYGDPRPERLVGFLDRYGKNADWNAFPPAVGLYAVVFREHPDWIDRLMPSQFDARTADAVDAMLQLSGNSRLQQALKSRAGQAGHDARLQAELANLPSQVTDIRIVTPTHLDIFWGAFFASGDARYVRPIIEFMAQTANRSEPIALDLAATAVAMSGGPKEILGQLKGKYGDALAREIVFAATATWGLGANARRHQKVAEAMAAYVSEHPGTNATKVLSVVRPRAAPSGR
jgi:hypothetical protein